MERNFGQMDASRSPMSRLQRGESRASLVARQLVSSGLNYSEEGAGVRFRVALEEPSIGGHSASRPESLTTIPTASLATIYADSCF